MLPKNHNQSKFGYIFSFCYTTTILSNKLDILNIYDLTMENYYLLQERHDSYNLDKKIKLMT